MIKRIILAVLGIVIIALIAAWLFLESIVTTAVNKIGSQVTGTEVSLQGFQLSPFAGTAAITGLTVANPENYKSPYLLSLGGVSVKLDVMSLLSDTIVINDITVSKPVITYEMLSLTQNNIKQLQANIAKNTASAPKPTTEAKKEETPANAEASKRVIIEKVTVDEGELKAVTAVPGDEGLIEVKLPQITLTNIGGSSKKESASIVSSVTTILNKILTTASETVVKSGLNNLKDVAEKNLNNVVGGVKDKIKSFGIFGK